jgi:hypothetical protein
MKGFEKKVLIYFQARSCRNKSYTTRPISAPCASEAIDKLFDMYVQTWNNEPDIIELNHTTSHITYF